MGTCFHSSLILLACPSETIADFTHRHNGTVFYFLASILPVRYCGTLTATALSSPEYIPTFSPFAAIVVINCAKAPQLQTSYGRQFPLPFGLSRVAVSRLFNHSILLLR